MLCGVFVHAARMRQLHPVLTYCRAALRLATLAATLPRVRTRLTAAGRSQLAAYLFHDSVLSPSPYLLPLPLPLSLSLGLSLSLSLSLSLRPEQVFSLGSYGLAVLLPEALRAAALAALARWLPPPSSMAKGLGLGLGLG